MDEIKFSQAQYESIIRSQSKIEGGLEGLNKQLERLNGSVIKNANAIQLLREEDIKIQDKIRLLESEKMDRNSNLTYWKKFLLEKALTMVIVLIVGILVITGILDLNFSAPGEKEIRIPVESLPKDN